MDKHNRYMTKDGGRSIVLERQQRISIESNSHMLIKNTQTQVRELYRRDNRESGHSLEPKKSSSLSDTRIMATRDQVDSLNRQIENEIGRLKYFRDYFLRPEVKAAAAGGPNAIRASIQQQRQQFNQICRQNLNATRNNNTDNNTTIDEAQLQYTDPIFSLNIPGATPRPEVPSKPRFRTLGVKPLSKEEKEMIDTMETTDATDIDSDEVSRERISGGCTFSHCSVYQDDYSQSGISPHLVLPISSPLTSPSHYHGTNRCCCCKCQQGQTAGSSSPVSFRYSTGESPYHHQSPLAPAAAVVAAPQHYPNVQPYYMCSSPHPNYSRRVTDLNTEDFCRHWCRNMLDSRSASHDRSSRTTTTRGSTRATSPRSRSVSRSPSAGKGRFDYHLKNKLKEAGVSDSSSLAHYKVQNYEKITKVTLRKQSPAADHKMSKRSDNEQMHIKDYVPAKTPPDGKDAATNKKKTGTYNKYMTVYEKDHNKSLESSSPLDSPNVESTPTYTKIQGKSPTPTIRTYGPTKAKPQTQSNESNSSRDSSKSSKLPLSTRRLAYQPHQAGYKKMDDKTSDSAQRTKDVTPSIPSAPKQEYRQSIDKTSKFQSESDSAQRSKRITSPSTPKPENRQWIDKTSKVQSESDSAKQTKRIPPPSAPKQEYRHSIDKTSKVQSESDSAQRTKRLPSPTGKQEYRQSIDKTSKFQSESDSAQRSKRITSPSTPKQEYRQSIDKTSKVQSESDSAERTKRLSSPTGKQEYRQSIDKTSKVQSESESAQRAKRIPPPSAPKQEYRHSIDKTSKVQSESDSAERTKRLPPPKGQHEYRQSIDKTSKVQSESDSAKQTKRIPFPSAPNQEYRQSIDKTYNAHSESDSSQRTKRVPSPIPSAANQEYQAAEDLAGERSRNEVVPKENQVDQSQRLPDDQSNGKKEKEAIEPKIGTDQNEIRSLDEGKEESTKFIENHPQGATTSAAYKSPIKESSPDALRDKHDDQPSRRLRDNTSNESMREGTSPSRPDYSQNMRDSYDDGRQMQRQRPVFEHSRDKDSDSGLERYSDSGNQPQTNYNRQPMAQTKTDPNDGRWGIEGGHRLSLASKPISGIPEKRMELATGEVASTTSICRTWSQRSVSIKRPEQEGGSYLRRETQRFNKECVRYITTDIGPDAKISQTSTKKREFSSTQGTQTLHKKPSILELDSPYPQQDGRLSGTITPAIPKKLEERLTQTEILSREERPTQTELLEANREERRTQTEPNERHERLTQTDLLTRDRHERLTQTELQEMPQNEVRAQTTNGPPTPKNVSGDKSGSSTPRKRNLQSSASPRQSKQIEKPHQLPKGQQTKDSNQQQGRPEQSLLQGPQRRASMSYYNMNGPGQKPLHTASSQNQQPASSRNYSQYGKERASYSQAESQAKSRQLAVHGVHQVPTQHDLNPEQPRAATRPQLERRIRNDFGRQIADPEEIICQQYDREDLQSRHAVPGSNRYPNDQIPSNRSRRDQLNNSFQSGEPSTNTMQRSMPQSYVNSYEWCGGSTYEKNANSERCTTFSRSAMQRSIDSNDDILPSETDEPCCSYIDNDDGDDDYNGRQQMALISQAPSTSYCQQQAQEAYNLQEEDIYSQYPMHNSVQDDVITMPISAYTRHSRTHQHQDMADLRRAQGLPRDSCINSNKMVADKRSRTVKFNDQNDEICPAERQRSSIDWEKAYQNGLVLDKMNLAQLNESPADDEDAMQTFRSSSSNNTDVTCIDSNCEDEYVTCDEEDDFMKNLPPFQGCPCMLETYYHLASIRSDR
ncbi:uncharacterized protein LOC6645771 isoform X1 [Drosophila willistoni]|uniref:uncharacterized protein LOC6645771 isoform X1 n=1 Tax=Drosophila willistoni TaxID=7260 RepID=UPI000C26D61C|nr:uncharacterized protein LOC6645771 isoform X1 [Drosophila willistoni]